MEQELRTFIAELEQKTRPLQVEMAEAHWMSQTTGLKEHQDHAAELNARLMTIYADPQGYARAKALRESGPVTDPRLARQLDIIYRGYLRSRMEPAEIQELVQRQKEIAADFTNFRAELDGEKVPDNRIREVLEKETDSNARRKAWEASKQIGAEVAGKVLELVRLRNRIANRLGYPDYYSMSLELSELDQNELFNMFDRLKNLTDPVFAAVKGRLDEELASKFSVSKEDLRPWHYSDPFFQEAPPTEAVDLNKYYEDKDSVELALRYYDGIGLEVRDILGRSDLYEREGKCQHAFCMDVNREGDVRILTNLRPDAKWMTTLLHELGHAVYNKYIDAELPFLLRSPAHTFVTEAIAQLNGRMSQNSAFLNRIVGVPRETAEALEKTLQQHLQLAQLIFARWGMVVAYFEREMYRNPDQDLNTLWWELVGEFQLVNRPENRQSPDWASKIHIANYPAYYQNYVLGEMAASQLWFHLLDRVLEKPAIIDEPAAGRFMRDAVFNDGALYHWNELLARATGEKLNPEYYVRQFIGG